MTPKLTELRRAIIRALEAEHGYAGLANERAADRVISLLDDGAWLTERPLGRESSPSDV
jgi:hypothetical protein